MKGTSGKPPFLPLPGAITSHVRVGLGPGLVYTNCHGCMCLHTEFQIWGLSPSKKRGGWQFLRTHIFPFFASSGGHNFSCRGRIGTGSGSYSQPCPSVPAHQFSDLGVKSFEKRGGWQFLGTRTFCIFLTNSEIGLIIC